MTVLLWTWAAAWLALGLWLEWKVDGEWLPGTGDIREDYTAWSVPPAGALTAQGERLWRTRYRVTLWGFLGWVVIAALWLIS